MSIQKIIKNQYGFSGLEVILMIVVTALLVGGVVYALNRQPSSPQSTDSSSTVISKSADPYAGWQTFTSKANGASFKYPANWTADLTYQNQDGYANEHGKITAPDGFELQVTTNPSGLGGACDNQDKNSDMACPLVETYSAVPFQLAGAPNTYLVKLYFLNAKDRSDQDLKEVGLYTSNTQYPEANQFLTTKEIFGYPPYLIVGTETQQVAGTIWLEGNYPPTNPNAKLSPEKYFALPDLKKAELVLKSLKLK